MRTVLKFDIQDTNEIKATPEGVDNFLTSPASNILDLYKGKVTMQDNYELTPDKLRESANKKDRLVPQ